MNQALAKVFSIFTETVNFLSNVSLRQNPFLILDILLVAVLLYWAFFFIRETRAVRIIYGILILMLFFTLGRFFQLQALNFIMKGILTMILVAIPIVFQPELRSILEKLGRSKFIKDYRHFSEDKINIFIENISRAVFELSNQNIGALIVIARDNNLKDYIETGELIQAKFSPALLKTIFMPKTPLHDGAVVIVGEEIVSASSILPLAEGKYDENLGTRHKAAIGMSSVTDALVIVVSEETGNVAIAQKGKLEKKLSENDFRKIINKALKPNKNDD